MLFSPYCLIFTEGFSKFQKWTSTQMSELQCFPLLSLTLIQSGAGIDLSAAHSASASRLEIHNVLGTQFCVWTHWTVFEWQRFKNIFSLCSPVCWYQSVCPLGLSIPSWDSQRIEDTILCSVFKPVTKIREDSLLVYTSLVVLICLSIRPQQSASSPEISHPLGIRKQRCIEGKSVTHCVWS